MEEIHKKFTRKIGAGRHPFHAGRENSLFPGAFHAGRHFNGVGREFSDVAPYPIKGTQFSRVRDFLADEALKHRFAPLGAGFGQWELSFPSPWVSFYPIFFHCKLKLSMTMES